MSQFPARKPIVERRGGERRPFKPKPWNHQEDLKALKGQNIRLRLPGPNHTEGWVRGVLVDADAYTLKVRVHSSQSVVTYFKSALIGYDEDLA